jgi:membrane protein insertase Oxa1/YidC/SpoIIIJ
MVPLGGCLGALLQMPVLLALFAAVRQCAAFGGRFLWIRDISKPDVVLGVVVAMVTGASIAAGPQPDMSAQQRFLMQGLPVVLTVITLWQMAAFNKNPQIIERLKIAGVVVFLILSIFFIYLSRKELNPKASNTKGNYFLKGIGMSSINMLGIPFYLGISIFLAAENTILIEQPYIILFVFGASIGSFLLFSTYIIFAKYISDKVSFIAKNINLILSILFLGLGIFTLVKILF